MSKFRNFIIVILSILTLSSAELVTAAPEVPPPTQTPIANCTLFTVPSVLTVSPDRIYLDKNQPVRFIIRVVDQGFTYDVYLRRGILGVEVSAKDLTPNSSGDITFTKTPDTKAIWQVGRHPIEVIRQGAPGNYCPNLAYEIKKLSQTEQVSCTILGPTEANIETPIKLSGTISPDGKYRFSIPSLNLNTNRVVANKDTLFSPDASGNIPEQNLGILNEGTYAVVLQTQVKVYDPNIQNYINTWQNVTSCRIGTIVVSSKKDKPKPNTSPTPIGSGQPTGPGRPSPIDICKTDPTKCSSAGGIPCDTSDPKNPGYQTAIGCIHTNPASFIKDVLGFVIGISGGLAFLMMLLGVFQMLTSAGNPETLAAGKDRLTNAIIGLLFVIFATLLLKIIGVDILGIPGF